MLATDANAGVGDACESAAKCVVEETVKLELRELRDGKPLADNFGLFDVFVRGDACVDGWRAGCAISTRLACSAGECLFEGTTERALGLEAKCVGYFTYGKLGGADKIPRAL